MQLIKSSKKEMLSLPCREVSANNLKSMGSLLAQQILGLLADKPMYPRDIAESLKVHEQKVYYHIRNLESAGIIVKQKSTEVKGAIANYYSLAYPSFAVRFKEFMPVKKVMHSNESEFLEPFIIDGQLKATIIVGSPDPHGPEKARSRDGYYGMDLALFFGTFLNYASGLKVRLDTEVRGEELKGNLIILGGPIVNSITGKLNDHMPIKFTDKAIKSEVSGKEYFADETGIIVKMNNPFEKSKRILVIAGKRYAGTRACIIAFLKHFREIKSGNKFNNKVTAKVFEGVDLDSDGVVDDVEVKE